ncbi:MAG: helix-hairpin-helix domain-containing protein, partial [Lachnospiraceae bacterium]
SGIVRMEAYDISNISGFDSVGSMVVYEYGRPKRSDYRKFRLRGLDGPDDYASMRQVLTRRFEHGISELEKQKESQMEPKFGSFTKFPDLILMDGGKGQVNIALDVLETLGLSIPVCGMVKDDRHRTRGLYYNNREYTLAINSDAFLLLTRIQDEAHRFAIEFHRSLRGKGQVHSVLDDIPNIGPARRRALMRHFVSIDAIREADEDALAALEGMDRRAAQSVYQFFHGSAKGN